MGPIDCAPSQSPWWRSPRRSTAPCLVLATLGAVFLLFAPPAYANTPLLRPGIVRYRGGGIEDTATPQCSSPRLSYFGGPILQNPTIVPVFWSPAVNATLQANIGQFYADIMVSSYWSWLQEYDTVGLTPGYNQAILPGTVETSKVLSPLQCATASKCTLTDAQLQAEIVRQINLGVLPAPSLDCTGNANTVYMVDIPANVTVQGPPGSGSSCVQFCAYHNTGTYGVNDVPLVYALVADVFTSACSTGCGGNPSALQNATETTSHELVEAVTDPDIGLVMQAAYAAPGAWADNNNQCGEVADICDDGGAGDTITVGGRTWSVQEIWSNRQAKCTSTGPTSPVCAGTTVASCRQCSCGDNGHACLGATSVCETTVSNALFGACEACTASDNTCGSGGACEQSNTPSQDDVCATLTPPVPALGDKTPLLATVLLLGGYLMSARRRRAA